MGSIIGLIEGNTRSLNYSSCRVKGLGSMLVVPLGALLA